MSTLNTPISHCAHIVLSADKFSENKRLSLNLRCFPYKMTPIYQFEQLTFISKFLQAEVYNSSRQSIARCSYLAKQYAIWRIT